MSTAAAKSAGSSRRPRPLNLLVIDGYAREGRAELEAGGASTAGELYRKMFAKCSPVGAHSDIVYPCDSTFTMPDLKKYDGVGWTGCSLTIYADEERVKKQIAMARTIMEAGLPQIGSCWAAQIATMAAGGMCAKNFNGREMGIARKIVLSPEGRAHPMYEGKPSVFDAFISHEDEVTHLPPGATSLASNWWTRHQAVTVSFKGSTFWGLQYHPEYDLHELARLTYCRTDKLVKMGFFQSREACHAYVADLEALHKDPKRRDLAWKLAIDADVCNDDVKLVEIRNWVNKQAIPFQSLRL
jgi:GMP synthase (glutamine-hydrolysing)